MSTSPGGTYPAVVFPARGQVEVQQQSVADLPRPGPGELRCRAGTSLVSTGTESYCLDGTFEPGTFWEEWVHYPFAPGYSMAAVVEQAGADVAGFAPGDRVALTAPHAGVVQVPAAEALHVPDEITDEQACWTSLACTTQLGVRRAGIELGESVAVVGLGLLGQLVVQYLRLCGARRIVAVDPVPARLEHARAGGATDLLALGVESAVEAVRDLTGGLMLDAAFDVTGHPAVLAPTTALVRPLGRVVLLGDTPTPGRQRLGPRIVADSVALLGVHASSAAPYPTPRDPWTLAAMAELFFAYLADGRMDVDGLRTHRLAPVQAPALYEALRTDRTPYLGVYFDWKAA